MVYRPLSAYAAIGNDDRLALVDGDGSIDWCCLPDVSAPSVFARLLDAERGGHFAVRPTAAYDSEQDYLADTNVLRTGFETATGQATVTDFMPVVAESRPPRYQHTILRELRCDAGCLTLELEWKPRFDYARGETVVRPQPRSFVATPAADRAAGDGFPSIDRSEPPVRRRETWPDERVHLQVNGPLDVESRGDRAVGTTILEKGESVWCVCQYGHFQPMPPTKCQALKEGTVEYWEDWVGDVRETVTDFLVEEAWLEPVLRSGLMLKLLINEGSGAIYAAGTTSLPEEYGGSRNWDYRYNWIRDAKFTVQALHNLGEVEEARRYFEWFREISHEEPSRIQPVYGTHGERELREETLDHLSGYRFSSPVRIGNAAWDQRQLDVYGTIVQGLYETQIYDEPMAREDWESIRRIVDHVCEVWDERGEGIWEFREEPRQYVHSKLLCWVALDRGIELARNHEEDVDTERWERERGAIREAIEDRGYSEEVGCFLQSFEAEQTIDASCLLVPIYEFLPPEDPRVEATIETVMEELMTEEGLVHRTTGPEAPEEGRGTFLFCTFWLVDALVLAGEVERAREVFENVLDHVDRPSLLPERIDPETGEFLGNFPQAFSHIGLVNSAIYLCSGIEDGELTHDPQDDVTVEPLFRS